MNEYEWAQSAISLSPLVILSFVTGYGLRLLQFGRRPPQPVEGLVAPSPLVATAQNLHPTPCIQDAAPTPAANPQDFLANPKLLLQERFKSGFLARTAHELRSPINSMVGLHQLILEDLCESPAEEREFIEQARDSAMKLLQRLDTVIAASKLDSGRERPKLAPLSVADLLRGVENLTLLQAANHNLRLTVILPDEEVSVHTDGRWLKALLVNLVEDAISNTPSGSVKLWCEPSSSDEQPTVLYLDSDRTTESLTEALTVLTKKTIEINAAEIEAQTRETTAYTTQTVNSPASLRSIQLSTTLVLATAHLMLPPMSGQIELLPDKDNSTVIKISLPPGNSPETED